MGWRLTVWLGFFGKQITSKSLTIWYLLQIFNKQDHQLDLLIAYHFKIKMIKQEKETLVLPFQFKDSPTIHIK